MTETVAYAVVHTEPPSIFLADDIDVLHRVLALEVVARTDPALLGDATQEIRDAVLEERWGDAVVAWIRTLGTGIDVYDGKSIYTADDLPADLIGAQLQFTRLFGAVGSARVRSAG
ncbi:MAG: hypothetical protein AAGC53_09930 [Actinomycetota bacterium]